MIEDPAFTQWLGEPTQVFQFLAADMGPSWLAAGLGVSWLAAGLGAVFVVTAGHIVGRRHRSAVLTAAVPADGAKQSL